MLESGHIDDAKAYLEGAADRLERDTFVIQSGNTALDGILNAKIEEATAMPLRGQPAAGAARPPDGRDRLLHGRGQFVG